MFIIFASSSSVRFGLFDDFRWEIVWISSLNFRCDLLLLDSMWVEFPTMLGCWTEAELNSTFSKLLDIPSNRRPPPLTFQSKCHPFSTQAKTIHSHWERQRQKARKHSHQSSKQAPERDNVVISCSTCSICRWFFGSPIHNPDIAVACVATIVDHCHSQWKCSSDKHLLLFKTKIPLSCSTFLVECRRWITIRSMILISAMVLHFSILSANQQTIIVIAWSASDRIASTRIESSKLRRDESMDRSINILRQSQNGPLFLTRDYRFALPSMQSTFGVTRLGMSSMRRRRCRRLVTTLDSSMRTAVLAPSSKPGKAIHMTFNRAISVQGNELPSSSMAIANLMATLRLRAPSTALVRFQIIN